jgi:hypothetical protein
MLTGAGRQDSEIPGFIIKTGRTHSIIGVVCPLGNISHIVGNGVLEQNFKFTLGVSCNDT